MAGRTSTITLTFLAKTQPQVDMMIERWGKYFDAVEYRVGTVKDFAQARNEVLARVTTDYWFWIDTDDDVQGIQNLRPIVEDVAARNIDALYLPYEYAYNEQGECIVLQWRERIVKTSHPFSWMGAVHEAAISTTSPLLDRSEGIIIQHRKTNEEHAESAERNHKILLREYAKKGRDPRITHYMALSYFNKNEFEKAIKLFQEHIKTSGWDEDQYRSWFFIGQAYGLLNDNEQVLWAAGEGIKLIPSRPECYVLAASAELEMRNFQKSMEWIMNATTKEPPKNSLSAIDPTYYGYKAEFIAAQAYLNMGKIKEAHQQLKMVLQHSPGFQAALQVAPLFQQIYDDDAAVTKVQWLVDYTKAYGGKGLKVLEALPAKLLADPRLNAIRAEITPPKKWSDKSIVFFSDIAAESWGPDQLESGAGGSEEAVIYLSRELAKSGWEVTVYNDRDEEYYDTVDSYEGVIYKPWTLFNPNDEFNVVIAWRNPSFFRSVPIKAKFKGVDMHDMPIGHEVIKDEYSKYVDKFFFKSEFQANIVDLPGKSVVISNGIVPGQFNWAGVKRNPLKVVYGSSADRGLECLVNMWPRIKAEVPDAELHWYYGWDSFDSFHRANPEQMKWKYKLIRLMHQNGVEVHGRVNHLELARAYFESGVWAYPTAFPEINCITALKTQAAGATPITSGYAALQETVMDEEKDLNESIYSDKAAQDEFIARVVNALQNPETEEVRRKRAKKVLEKYNWGTIAKQWIEAIQ